MTTKILGLFLFCLLSLNYLSAQHNEKRTTVDVDRDGTLDSIYTFYDGGSGFGGTYAEIVNGHTSRKYELDIWGCFCDTWLIRALPPESTLPQHKPFYDTLISRLFGDFEDKPDPSLQWILDAHTARSTPNTNSIYDLTIHVPFQWNVKPDSFNYSYSVKMDQKKLKLYYRTYGGEPEWFDQAPYGIIRKYNGYLQPKQSLQTTDSKLLIAQHGIMIQKKNGQVAWLFVTDPFITGGPEKLRWPSIGEIQKLDNLIIFELKLTPMLNSYVYVINTLNGKIGRLKVRSEKNFDGSNDGISTSENALKIFNEKETIYSKEQLLIELK